MSSVNEEVSPSEVADKKSPERLSILNKSMDEPKKDSTNEGATPDETKEKHPHGAISIVNKPKDESKNDFTNKVAAEEEKLSPESAIVSCELEEKPSKNSTKRDSTLPQATTETNSPNLNSESLKEISPIEERKPFPERNTLGNMSSTNEVNPKEVADKKFPENLSIFNKSMDEPKKDSTNEGVTPDETKDKHSQGAISIVNKPKNESKNDFICKVAPEEEKLSPEAAIVSCELEEKPSKNSTKTDSTISEATTETNSPNLNSESLKAIYPIEERKFFPDSNTLGNISSTNEEVNPNEVADKKSPERLSIFSKSMDEPKNNSTNEGATPDEAKEKHSQGAISIVNESMDESKNDFTNKVAAKEEKPSPEVAIISCESEENPNKNSTKTDSTLSETTPETNSPNLNSESLKEISPIEERKPSPDRNISGENTTRCTADLTKPGDCSRKKSTETSPIDCEFRNEWVLNPNEVADKKSPERFSILNKSVDEPKKDSTNEGATPDETKEKHSQGATSIVNKPRDESKNDFTNEAAPEELSPEDAIVSCEPEEKPNKNATKTDSTFSEATAETNSPNLISESLKEISPVEEGKHSPDRNISGENTPFTADFTKPGDCSSKSTETSPIDCELLSEVDKFLIKEITTHFQVRFLSEEEIEAINWFSEDEKKDSNVHVRKQDEAIQADLVSLNNQNIPTLVNLAQTAMLEEKKQIPVEHVGINDNVTKRDQSLFKSPKPENKEATPNKAKTPSAGKVSVKDIKDKTAFNQNQSVTPLITLTGTPKSSVSSAGKNATEEKTPKKLKSNSAASKSCSPCFKTPTNKGASKLQSKSCEKTERNQNLSATKASAEIAESSSKSASATNTKSRRFSDSSKPLPTVVQPKLGEKDPLKNLKSSSIVSESIPKGKMTATDIPIASEKGKSTNPKSENCQKSVPRGKTAGSSSAKSTDQSESKTKSSEESLDVRSCKESSSSTKKSDQNKGNEPSKAPTKSIVLNTAHRTRNVHEKNTSSDPKNEKPRWR